MSARILEPTVEAMIEYASSAELADMIKGLNKFDASDAVMINTYRICKAVKKLSVLQDRIGEYATQRIRGIISELGAIDDQIIKDIVIEEEIAKRIKDIFP